ncbi:hypothetical protein BL250_07385 [Erwinia sp. OLTSP20]|uniref:DUF1479 domain-containing protein n=1 Tax=unclassified Erwinia TaxID=2622719 RepID=UPI000C181EA0|nr:MULTISPECIES: DUF1479 domain-containing protein [unclassified Erwinia]PIJ50423.1 hypothetical protein BV501_08500 [Erwinia sp. OAMSP11]PIJ72494.1 hypothetical protein BK416_09100 [Erwinia sp. OLSSP12]PIJ81732.1 hypothetical protein BLD47_07930 [Erwinia sp. OLCASP19]PIJ84325.1 hypothetical protein BLD46_08020 [Erwinia sp. OLMTSP26]PIJ86189.1 hypothetical protein BLD49_08630 [Erwinia sp. OLMDSP33]
MTTFSATTLPADHKKNIVNMKRELRAQIGDVAALFQQVCAKIEGEITAARQEEKANGSAWPIVDWQTLAESKISAQQIAHIKRRGCLVVRQTFPRQQALAMDKSMLDYLASNHFDENYRGPGDNFFGSLEASKPEIYPIYWSPAQMAARQSQQISVVQSFLNRLWKYQDGNQRWFDPDVNIIYPDRIRRRPPATTSKGLGAHTDSGALERWLLPAYQKVFHHIFTHHFERYDPWDAAHRPDVHEYEVANTTKCSAFRTFQGWTALSDMPAGQGMLHVVPVPEAMAYILLRPLLDDVPDDELCGVAPGRVLPVSEKWHPHLINGLCTIPPLQAGDAVWWHCDVIHAVAPVENQQGWSNVMYIPAAPACPKNLAYAEKVRQAFHQGLSPADFPAENYEQHWQNRFQPAELNENGRRGLAMQSEK